MTALETALLSRDEARSLTDEVKQDAVSLREKLLRLYEGAAHLALGYDSWKGYWDAEFDSHWVTGYRELDAARVDRAISHLANSPLPESHARELVKLLDEPERLRDVYAEVIELHEKPTADDVREAVQRRMGVHYSSATDLWATPQDLFDALDAEFGFGLDVCATTGNAKCPTFFTEAQNGLEQEWRGVCWMNPPYGDVIKAWVQKAYTSSTTGATVVCLVPARTDTGWWWEYCTKGEIRFIRGRLKFGGADTGAPFPSAVVVFGRKPDVVWWDSWRTA